MCSFNECESVKRCKFNRGKIHTHVFILLLILGARKHFKLMLFNLSKSLDGDFSEFFLYSFINFWRTFIVVPLNYYYYYCYYIAVDGVFTFLCLFVGYNLRFVIQFMLMLFIWTFIWCFIESLNTCYSDYFTHLFLIFSLIHFSYFILHFYIDVLVFVFHYCLCILFIFGIIYLFLIVFFLFYCFLGYNYDTKNWFI